MIEAITGAIIYALSGYLKSNEVEEDGEIHIEPLNPYKFGATVVIGGVIGASSYALGLPLTEAAVEQQIAAYAGLTMVTENILKALHRQLIKKTKAL